MAHKQSALLLWIRIQFFFFFFLQISFFLFSVLVLSSGRRSSISKKRRRTVTNSTGSPSCFLQARFERTLFPSLPSNVFDFMILAIIRNNARPVLNSQTLTISWGLYAALPFGGDFAVRCSWHCNAFSRGTSRSLNHLCCVVPGYPKTVKTQ